MRKNLKRTLQWLTAIACIVSLATSLAFGTTYSPVFAQAVDGSLIDLGQGDSRILTSDWQTLNAGQQITYQFAYDGNEQPVSVWMNAVPADSANFQIWTTERLEDLQTDANTQPLGQGTAMNEGSGFTNWQGGSPEAETYFVVVSPTGDASTRFLLNVSSPALAEVQPGAIAQTPVTSTVTAPADPNIAVVTTDALNVRSGPSTAFPVLTTIYNSEQMTVLGRNGSNTWLNVRLADGTEGWVTRTLTSYTAVATNVIATPLLPIAAASVAAGVTATNTVTTTGTTTGTTAISGTAPVTTAATVSVTELSDNWQVLSAGETQWFTFQYRGGNLPLTVWMDMEPFGDANFTVVDAETAQAMMAGTVVTPTAVIARGISNPIQPGYTYWQADFPEADTFYVMVTPDATATGDVLYSIYALGPGVGRVIQPVP